MKTFLDLGQKNEGTIYPQPSLLRSPEKKPCYTPPVNHPTALLKKAYCWKVNSVVSFVITGVCIRYLTAAQFTTPPFPITEILWAESLLGLLILKGVDGLSPNCFKDFELNLPSLIRTAFAIGGLYFYYLSLKHLKFVEGIASNLLTPSLGLILAWCLFKEKLKPGQWMAIALSFLGVVLILWGEFWRLKYLKIERALVYPLLSALCLTLSKLLTRRLCGMGYQPQHLTLQLMIALFLLTNPIFYDALIVPSWPQIWVLISLSALNLWAHYSFAQAYRYSGVSLLTPVSLIKLIFAVLMAYVVFGETPLNPLFFLMGSAFLLSGIYLTFSKI